MDRNSNSRGEKISPFGRIFDANVIGLIFSRADGTIVDANTAALNLLGYDRADLATGRLNWRTLTPPEYTEMSESAGEQLKGSGTARPFEKEYVRKNGTRVPVLIGASRIEADDADYLTYIVDLTDRRNVERQMQASQERLESYVRERTKELASTSAFLDSLIDNIPNMIFVKDAKDLRFVRFNKAGEKLLGLSRDELIGKTDFDLFPKEEAETFRERDRAVLKGRAVVDIPEEPISTKANGPRFLHTKKIPVFDEKGNAVYLLGISEDITSRKRADEERFRLVRETVARMEAEKSAERSRFMSEASAALGSSLDFEKTLQNLADLAVPRIADWCSIHLMQPDGSLRLISIAHKDPKKTSWAWELNQKYPPQPGAPYGVGKVARTGVPELVEIVPDENVVASAQDDEHLHILRELGFHSSIAVPIRARGRILGTLSLVTTVESGRKYNESDLRMAEDLTERAGYAIDNARLYKEAQNLNRVKDEFLATLSHELRTPLNVIQGYTELLQIDGDRMSPEEIRNAYQAIHRNAQSQTQIIGDLLDVSSIVTGKINFKPERLSPSEIATSVFENVSAIAESRGIQLTVDASKAPPVLYADPTRLQQILWNLVSNSLKFTPNGGRVLIRMFEEGGDCVTEVTDTGKGIDEEFLPFVFERFRQEDSGTTRKFGGLGLGLSIVRHLVELHGGAVAVESEGPGRGSKFTVRLPLQPRGSAAVRPAPQAPGEAAECETKEDVRLDGLTVLVVEDSEDSRDLVRRYLVRAGAEVLEADSVREARRIIEGHRPDIIVSDIGMPGEDGVSFIRKYRESEKATGSFTPAIALTAYVRQDERDQMLKAGFQAHVSKPVSRRRLLQEVAELTSGKRRPIPRETGSASQDHRH